MMNERLLGEAIRKGIASAVNPLKERVVALEELTALTSQRRLIDAHIGGALFNQLIKQGSADRSNLQAAVKGIARSLKQNTDDDWDLNQLINEHVDDWLERLGD